LFAVILMRLCNPDAGGIEAVGYPVGAGNDQAGAINNDFIQKNNFLFIHDKKPEIRYILYSFDFHRYL